MKHFVAVDPTPRKVVNAATLWRSRRNSAEIARALHVPEAAALGLIARAREEGLLPACRKLIIPLLLIAAAAVPAQADPDVYLGGFIGAGGSGKHSLHDADENSRAFTRDDQHPVAVFGGGYGGLGDGPFAIEGGALTLPTLHAVGASDDPPRSAYQTITGHAYFARGLLRAPPNWHWAVQPYAFFGAAKVYGENHEVAGLVCTQCGVGYVPDWRNWTKKWTPYYGIGAEIPVYGPISTRLEFGWLPHAVNSFWTHDRDYALGSVAMQYRF